MRPPRPFTMPPKGSSKLQTRTYSEYTFKKQTYKGQLEGREKKKKRGELSSPLSLFLFFAACVSFLFFFSCSPRDTRVPKKNVNSRRRCPCPL